MKTAVLEKMQPARSVSELFSVHDEAFVRCAYQTVLGRDADPSGLVHFTECLRAGTAKIDILLRLRQSDEARQVRMDLGWLDSAITRHHRATRSRFGWLFRFSRKGERIDPLSNRVRAIDNNVNRLCDNIEGRLERLEQVLDRMEFKLDRQKDALVEFASSSAQPTQTGLRPSETEAPSFPARASSSQALSPRASRVLSGLRAARAAADPSLEI